MAILPSSSLLSQRKLIYPSSIFAYSSHIRFRLGFQIMNSTSKSEPKSVSSSTIYQVPGLDSHEMDSIAEKTFERYSSKTVKRNGKGISIVWYRNDLRVLDNEALFKAWVSSEAILPVYCIDPRLFETTYCFGFPKTGALRAQFIIECLADLKKNLMKKGLDLLIQRGKPEDILPSLAKAFGAHTVECLPLQAINESMVYAHKETCSEELQVERLVTRGLRGVVLSPAQGNSTSSSSTHNPKLELIWGSTMYHLDDLPISISSLPDVYTQFQVNTCSLLKPNVPYEGASDFQNLLGQLLVSMTGDMFLQLSSLDFNQKRQANMPYIATKGMRFLGGETAALSRVSEYFWKKAR
ncbi:DNA photolyase [Theobroma cacao]|nr:DNA photolyase [Theobroma cacao]